MAKIPLTEKDIDNILKSPKVIKENVQWHLDPNHAWAKCELKVENKLKVDLRLYLNWNIEVLSLFSFSLILSRAYRISGLDYKGSHKNTHTDNNIWQGESHIHIWTEKCRNTWAFTPENISNGKIEDIFKLFCEKYNIDFKGRFYSLPSIQEPLFKEI